MAICQSLIRLQPEPESGLVESHKPGEIGQSTGAVLESDYLVGRAGFR